MVVPRIVRYEDAILHQLHGHGRIKRLIYPSTCGSIQLFTGIAETPPGEAPHVFHRHGTEVIGDVRVEYAPDFEEFYFVVEGAGSMQWKTDGHEIVEAPVKAGDSIYMPRGCVEHRIFNSGTSMLRVLYGGTPPAKITKLTAAP